MCGDLFKTWLVLVVCVCVVGEAPLWAGIVYVDAAATGANDGSSWQNACKFLQNALKAAAAAEKPVEIRVAQGVYKPDQGAGITPGDQAATIQLLNGVTLKGGYAGTAAPDPDARDMGLYETVLNGDLAGNDSESFQSMRDDSCHVVTGRLVDSTAVMDGLVVTGGNWETLMNPCGTGTGCVARVFIDAGSPTIRDCQFRASHGIGTEAVVFLGNGSAPTLTGCVFSDNDIAMEIVASRPILLNCLFKGNKRQAMSCGTNSVASLTNCRFESNRSGIANSGDANLTLNDCTFVHNAPPVEGWSGTVSATNCVFQRNSGPVEMSGGGLTLTDCRLEGNKGGTVSGSGDIVVIRCSFTGNSGQAVSSSGNLTATDCIFTANAGLAVGAIWGGDVLTLRNCEFSGNSGKGETGAVVADGVFRATGCLFTGNSGKHAGAVSSHSSVFLLSNCTFADNRGEVNAIRHEKPGPVCPAEVTQCIIRDGPPAVLDESSDRAGPIRVTYSDVQGGYAGQGNIDADPCFVSPGHWAEPNDPSVVLGPEIPNAVWVPGDYHLKSQAGHWDRASEAWVLDEVTSVCIDAGDPNGAVGSEAFPNGGFVNIGAYGGTAEASRSYFGHPICETQIAGDINGDCVVDDTDMEILTSHWLQQGWPVTDLRPTITITQPQDGDEFDSTAPVTIRANASDPDGSVIRVLFVAEYRYLSSSRGTGFVDTDPSDGWGWNWLWSRGTSSALRQTWTISAQAMDNDGNITVSPEIKVTIRVKN